MTPQLKTFMTIDEGFRQYSEQYHCATDTQEVRDEYQRWIDECLRINGIRDYAINEGRAKGRAEGRTEGRTEGIIEVAKNLLSTTVLSSKQVSEATGLSLDEVEKLMQGASK